ncbi:MAG: hypothetical protein ACOCZA_04130 [Spirochaetota bacterium]
MRKVSAQISRATTGNHSTWANTLNGRPPDGLIVTGKEQLLLRRRKARADGGEHQVVLGQQVGQLLGIDPVRV